MSSTIWFGWIAPIPGLSDLYSLRAEFAGRTGGETIFLDLDNVNIGAVVPNPPPPLWA